MVKRLFVLASAVALSAASAAHSQGKVTTLRAVSFIRLDIDDGRWFKEWTERVNKACAAYVKIDLRGGPEVMNPFQQPVALKNGVVDMVFTIPAFMQRFIPWALAYNLAKISPMEQRKNGAYAYMDKLIGQRAGAHILLNNRWTTRFHIFMAKKKLKSLDLTGLKFRTLPIYRPMIEKMGGTAITMNQSELFTALERGTVDGYGYISYDLKAQGWNTVTKYRVDPGFYHVSAVYTINLKKWKSLSPAARGCLTKDAIAYEKYLQKLQARVAKEGKVKLLKNGVQIQQLPPEMAKKFLEIARTAGWNDVKRKAPKEYPTLRKLLD
jgi:TRAP-type C4-dicarboxylate transport system substrate-binding protein